MCSHLCILNIKSYGAYVFFYDFHCLLGTISRHEQCSCRAKPLARTRFPRYAIYV